MTSAPAVGAKHGAPLLPPVIAYAALTILAAIEPAAIAGIAVTGLLGHLLPAPLAAIGLALALVCELAVLTTLASQLDFLLPIARFGGLVWLVCAAFTLAPKETT